MKKNKFFRISMVMLILAAVSACVVGSTLAKYSTTINGSSTVSVASWSFKAGAATAGTSAFEVAFDGSGAGDKLLPGDTGTFVINLDGTGADAGVDVAIAFTTIPTNITLKLADSSGAEITTSNGVKGTIAYSTTTDAMKTTITIYWAYADVTAVQTEGLSLAFTVTGEQAAADKAAVAFAVAT